MVESQNLCSICSAIQIKKGIDICAENEYFPLFSTFAQLETSAESGCHLCLLLRQAMLFHESSLDGIKNLRASSNPVNLRISQTRVALDWTRHDQSVWRRFDVVDLGDVGKFTQARIEFNSDSEVVFDLASQWLKECDMLHKHCNHVHEDHTLPCRVLDVGSQDRPPYIHHSVPGEKARYLALSYCWGKGGVPNKTTTANLSQYVNEIPLQDMPKTIYDAVLVTRRLGLKYLWIDSLCIVQDDPIDWVSQSAVMAKIFEGAYCTISASSASDANDGLLYERESQRLSIPPACSIDGKCILPDYPSWNVSIESTMVSSRAWIWQERGLSTRNLHFTMHGLFWECRTSWSSEFAQPRISRERDWILSNALPEEYFEASQIRKGILYPLVMPGSNGLCIDRKAWPRDWLHQILTTPVEPEVLWIKWRNLVSDYGEKYLTRDGDRLVALSGAANAYRMRTDDDYLAGHWRSQLLQSLAWASDRVSAGDVFSRPNCYVAPSWSWAATKGMKLVDSRAELSKFGATITECSVVLASEDPCGQVKAGLLVLKAPFLELSTEVAAPLYGLDGQRPKNYYSVAWGVEDAQKVKNRVFVTLDLALELPPRQLFLAGLLAQSWERNSVYHLVWTHVLVVAPLDRSINRFVRVGLGYFSDYDTSLWFMKHAEEEVFEIV